MKKLLYILILLPVINFSQVNTDSLWNVWNDSSKPDTVRLKAIQDFTTKGGYMSNNRDSALYFSKLQYEFAQRNNEKKYIAIALNNIGALSYISSNYNEAIDYFKQSLSIQSEINNNNGIVKCLLNLGLCYQAKSDYYDALKNYSKALIIIENSGDKSDLPNLLNLIGNIHRFQGNNSKAIDYYTRSLKLCKSIDSKKVMSSVLNNIGVIYRNQEDYEKALEYYKKSLIIKKEIGKLKGQSVTLNNIGEIYSHKKSYSLAIEYFNKSINIKEEIGDSYGIAASLNNIGLAYFEQSNFELSLINYERSLEIRRQVGDKKGTANSINRIGNVFFKQEKYIKALDYCLQSKSIAVSIGDIEEIRNASESLINIYKKLGNFKEALNMYELYISSRDSILSEKNLQEIIRQEYKYDYDKKEAIANAENKAAIENQQLEALSEQKQQNIIIGSICFILFIGGLFLAYISKRLKITKKQRNKIYKQKAVIETVQIETEQQKLVIEEAHTEIKDSINYAKRLQNAIFPSFGEMNEFLPNSFLYFNPKDVVSGDFYWFENIDNISYLAVADCTGHGVPGAMVSVVCSNALNRSVKEFGIKEPSKILDKTRELVIETFAKSGEEVQDGMDIALCAFKDDKVLFSGANNPLWIVRSTDLISEEQKMERSSIIDSDLSLIEYKANRQPVGLYQGMQPFNQYEVELFKGDLIYIFTDGFADQFGGEKGKKFKYKAFKQLLIQINGLPMKEQSQILSDTFENWRGELEQIDDVCVIGIRI